MQERKVTLLIEENGSVTIDVEGVKGPMCTHLTKEVEEALGTVKECTKKVEYSQIQSQAAAQQQLRG